MRAWALLSSSALALALAACRSPAPAEPDGPSAGGPRAPCSPAPLPLASIPGLPLGHDRPDFWLGLLPPAERDRVLLDEAAIGALNLRNSQQPGAFRDVFALPIEAPEAVAGQIVERFEWLAQRLATATLKESEPGSFGAARALALAAEPADELRAVHTEARLQCVPMGAALYEAEPDERFDHNRCSGLHPGELLRVLRRAAQGWLYVHAGHAVGWVQAAALTPSLPRAAARRLRDGTPRLVVLRDRAPAPGGGGAALRMGVSFPLLSPSSAPSPADEPWSTTVPTPEGLRVAPVQPGPDVRIGWAPLTRRAVFGAALAQLGSPYGWGGRGGGRDCSRFVLDLLAGFGLRLGRHSAVQARSGSEVVELEALSESAKRAALREAASRGIVLLHMPGHVMLYLGAVGERDFALSSVAELRRPCGASGGVQRLLLDRVVVTDLEPGRGTPRAAFIERLTRAAVFGS